MTLMYYFAYGSNLHPGQMAWRCPRSRPIQKATLPGYDFRINTDGAATLVRQADGHVHGVIWFCTQSCIKTLDHFEGVSSGIYRRTLVPLKVNGKPRAVLTYIANNIAPSKSPARGYLSEFVIGGAMAFGLPDDYIQTLWQSQGTHFLRTGRPRPTRPIDQTARKRIAKIASET